MNSQISEYTYSLLMRLKAPSKLITLLAIILATCWYILNPAGNPYISTAGNYISFEIPLFKECTINFRNPLTISHYIVKANNLSTDTGEAILANPIIINKIVTSVIIKNSYYMNQKATGPTQSYQVIINTTSSLSTEIEAISIDKQSIELKSFFNNYHLEPKGEYIRFRYIRKDLADVIFLLNESFSNWIFTLMFFGIIVLIVRLAGMEIKAYLYSDRYFRRYLANFLSIQNMNTEEHRQDAWDRYTAYWAKWDTWLRYLQVLGPALGFILTVSSLIQALHPIVGASHNIDEFLRGIHVAMISTFLGLLLRIVALEGDRVNDILLRRTDLLLTQTETEAQVDNLRFFEGNSVQ